MKFIREKVIVIEATEFALRNIKKQFRWKFHSILMGIAKTCVLHVQPGKNPNQSRSHKCGI
jgi:hypothetical protein